MNRIQTYYHSQVLADIARRLVEYGALKSAYIVPSELIDFELWSQEPGTGEDKFGPELGRLAAPLISRELANAIYLNMIKKNAARDGRHTPTFRVNADEKFRIGIAAGSTIYGFVEGLELPARTPTRVCEITPLVVGPIPETTYSAGFIAETMKSKLVGSTVTHISDTAYDQATGFRIKIKTDYLQARDALEDTSKEAVDKARLEHNGELLSFNFLITGIGSAFSGQLQAHIDLMYKKKNVNPPELDALVGDICSRLFRLNGEEIQVDVGNHFVAISYRWLQALSRLTGHRVIAVAGGLRKVEAIYQLLIRSRGGPDRQLFNVLITDELTARRLLRNFNSE